jgi:predicted dienelactone hydrolase
MRTLPAPPLVGPLLLLVACSGDDPPRPEPEPFDPLAVHEAPGAWNVGYREETATWEDPLLPEPRALRLAVWYPTDDETGASVRYSGLFPDEEVLGDATPVGGPLPLVLFSHGHQGFAENSAFLMRHLASHGWLVAAPDHTGNTTFDGPDRTTAIYWERPLDLAAVLAHVADTFEVTDEVGAVGHSFGGFTMHAVAGAPFAMDDLLPACLDGSDDSDFCSTMDEAQAARLREDLSVPEVRAVVAMAPGDFRLFGASGIGAIDVPELLLTGGNDPSTTSDGDLVWAALPADRQGFHVPTMGHQGFTDFSGTVGDPPGSIDPEEGWRIVRTVVSAFLDWKVRGDDRGAPLLDGTLEISPLAAPRER